MHFSLVMSLVVLLGIAAGLEAREREPLVPTNRHDAPGSLKEGERLLERRQYAEAAAYFERIGEQTRGRDAETREPRRLVGLATAYLQLGRYDETIIAATRALRKKAYLEDAWFDLGAAEVFELKRDKAKAIFIQGIAQLKAHHAATAKLEANLNFLNALDAEKMELSQRSAVAQRTGSADKESYLSSSEGHR
jgi:tetratricopeptide (TPR) repeat protein